MSREEIINMAREAYGDWYPNAVPYELERFANLVASAEREACAMLAEQLGVHPALNVYNGGPDWYKHGKKIAAEIRARGNDD